MRAFSLALLAIFLLAAAPAPLVFIHGIKGAALVAPDGDVRWLTASQALGFSTPDLRLHDGDDLRPGAILRDIAIIPHLVAFDVYGPFLDAAPTFGRPFYPFAYDWRRDNLETVATFTAFLEEVRRQNGGAKVDVVAHSMGGLITLAVINQRPDLIGRVVFAGVPFPGGIGFLPDLQEGAPTGLNSKIMGPDVLATYPSVFSLFSLPEHSKSVLLDEKGKVLTVDFFAAEDWRRLHLAQHVGDSVLARAKAFRLALAKASATYPPALVIASQDHPTLVAAMRRGSSWDFESAPKAPGDGRVAYTDAQPPGISHEVFLTHAEHAALLNDPAVIAALRRFLSP